MAVGLIVVSAILIAVAFFSESTMALALARTAIGGLLGTLGAFVLKMHKGKQTELARIDLDRDTLNTIRHMTASGAQKEAMQKFLEGRYTTSWWKRMFG
jgi:hypothetical protein